MRVLISGFEPFGDHTVNPTAKLVEALANKEILHPPTLKVDQILLPVTFSDAFETLQKRIDNFNPDVIMAFGLARRETIELETTAVNIINSRIADNAGHQPLNRLISPNGPPSFCSTLPLQGIENTLKTAGIPVKTSNDAGAFVCNYLFYRLMETNQETFRLCGFIHVPLLPEQAGPEEKSMALPELFRAVSLILHYIDY